MTALDKLSVLSKLPIVDFTACEFPIQAHQVGIVTTKNQPIKNQDVSFSYKVVGRDLDEVILSVPISWDMDPYNDRNWCAQLHMWRLLDANILKLEGDEHEDYISKVVDIILDWHSFSISKGQNWPLVWSDMMVGLRSMRLAYVVAYLQKNSKSIGNCLNDKKVNSLNDVIKHHLEFLLDIDNYKFNNHSIHDIHGLMALSKVVIRSVGIVIEEFITAIMSKLIQSQFNDNGIHLENSPEYHGYGINCFRVLYETGWFNSYGLKEIIEKASDLKDWFILPDGRLLPFGDTTRKTAFKKSKNSLVKYIGTEQLFNNSGYAILRNSSDGTIANSSYLALMGALNSRAHKQSDDLSLFWFEGEEILSDMGKYAYQSDNYRKYAISTAAHNTIEVNEDNYYKGNSIEPKQMFGSAVESVSVHDYGIKISAKVEREQLARLKNVNITHCRHVLYNMKKWMIVIDSIKSKDILDFTQWFNFAPGITVSDYKNSDDEISTTMKLASGRSLFILTKGGSELSVTRAKGQEEPRYLGWNSDSYKTVVASNAIGVKQRGKEVVFATLFNLTSARQSIEVAGGEVMLTTGGNNKILSWSLSSLGDLIRSE